MSEVFHKVYVDDGPITGTTFYGYIADDGEPNPTDVVEFTVDTYLAEKIETAVILNGEVIVTIGESRLREHTT